MLLIRTGFVSKPIRRMFNSITRAGNSSWANSLIIMLLKTRQSDPNNDRIGLNSIANPTFISSDPKGGIMTEFHSHSKWRVSKKLTLGIRCN